VNLWERKGIRVAVSMVVTGLALWLSFRKIDWQIFWASFSQVRWFWVGLATANVIFIVYALGWRWQILLRPKANIPMNRLFHLNIIGQYTNIIAPVRLGEIVRGYLAAKEDNLPGGYAIGTIVFEKILDFFIFLCFWIIIPIVFVLGNSIRGYRVVLIASGLVLAILAFLVLKPEFFLEFYRKISRIFPKKYREKLQNFFSSGMESFQLLKNWKAALVLVAITVAFIGGRALSNFFLFQAFGLKLSYWAALVVLLAVQAGNIPPSIPGKIGVFEVAVILALAVFGIGKGEALVYGIMLHLVAYLPKIILGQYIIVRYKIKW